MHDAPHGQFDIHWLDQICVVCLAGAFNRPGAQALHSALATAWENAGRPEHWAHIVDLRIWEGGTPKSFGAGRDMADWSFAHGVAVVIRLHHGSFLPRMVDRHGVLDASPVPVLDCAEISDVRAALLTHGFAVTGLEQALNTPGCGSAPAGTLSQ